MRPFTPVAAVLLSVAALAGCNSPGAGPTSRELSSAQFDDVPVPRSFALDLGGGRSFSYSEGGSGPAAIRVGRLEYVGRGSVDDVLAFYAAEMPRPLNGWTAAGDAGRGALRFRRAEERCVVRAVEEGGAVRIVVERNTGEAAGE